MPAEPFRVSARFRFTLESAIRKLQTEAARDEAALRFIAHPDHRRRQILLITAQLDRAFRLRQLLDRTALREDQAA